MNQRLIVLLSVACVLAFTGTPCVAETRTYTTYGRIVAGVWGNLDNLDGELVTFNLTFDSEVAASPRSDGAVFIFDVPGEATLTASFGMIAWGDIDAETGELLDLAELVDIESAGPVDLDIEWIAITSCKYHIDGIPEGDNPWRFSIWIDIVDAGDLDHIDVTKPGDSTSFATLIESYPGWWDYDWSADYPDLAILRLDYTEGT